MIRWTIRWFSWLVVVLAGASLPAQLQVKVHALPDLPDAVGRAGMAAGTVRDADGTELLLAVGGANFPEAMPWLGGQKAFWRDIYALVGFGTGNPTWQRRGELPHPIAYAAFAAFDDQLVVAGGTDGQRHRTEVLAIDRHGGVHELPPLPEPLAYAACVEYRGTLYVLGGQRTADEPAARGVVHALDLRAANGWRSWQWPHAARILATAAVLDGKLWLVGGCTLAPTTTGPPAQLGTPHRTYQADALAVWLADLTDERRALTTQHRTDLPHPLAACAGPAAAREGRLLLVGGDDGSHYGKPPQDHPGQRRELIALAPESGTWERLGELPQGLVTAPLCAVDGGVAIVSGETRPGVRTATVAKFRLAYAWRFGWLDAVTGLLAVAALLLALRALRTGRTRSLLAADDRPGRGAWLAVGLLFVVAMLNYLDRQLLATMAEPILRDVPQTNAQFGLLTAVFLFVYSALSPAGGILADRYGRRAVILVSLVVWSAVTWLTGHVRNYEELMIARALMGISEACYIPAALALITDHHRGRTRSLATGLHMGGVYAGQALAGLGGYAAEAVGWRTAFAVFGLVGVGYALVLAIWLREPDGEPTSGEPAPPVPTPKATASVRTILAALAARPAFWWLLLVMGTASISNWFVLSWLPKLLQDRFALGLGEAGALATLPSSLAKYVAVVVGGSLADRWSRRDPRGRSKLAGWAFVVAGPMVMLTTILPGDALPLFVVLVAGQGVAQGVLDATLMPIFRERVDERYAATGYGCLNLVGAGIGGLAVLYGGALKDAGIPLSLTLAASGGGLLLCGILLRLLPASPSLRDQSQPSLRDQASP